MGERLNQQEARERLTRLHRVRYRFEILARLRVGPSGGALIERLQTKWVVGRGMTNDATCMGRTLLEKDRLDDGFVGWIIEGLSSD